METLSLNKCKHCGNSCSSHESFCCSGCNIAYQLITQAGFSQFYNILNKQPLKTVSDSQKAFLELEFNENTVTEKITENVSQVTLLIENITCSACSWLLEKVPMINSKIHAVSYSPSFDQIIVQYNSQYPIIEVAKTFYKLGYPVHIVNSLQTNINKKNRQKLYIQVAMAFASMIATMHVSLSLLAGILDGMETDLVRSLGATCLLLSLPAVLYSAQPFYKNAWLSFKTKQVHIDALIALTIFVTIASGLYNIVVAKNEFYFDAMTTLVALILGARLLVKEMENRFYKNSSGSVLELISSHYDLKINQILSIKSGETFPCDGTVISGISYTDNSWLSGETDVKYIQKGSQVYAGTQNKGDLVQMLVTAVGQNTRAGKVLKLLKSTKKSPTQIKTEKAEQAFVALTALFIISISVLNIAFHFVSWDKIVALIIILCPCALGLAIPLTFSTAIKQAADKGIFFQNADSLEKMESINSIVFDKTGTLTKSKISIQRELWIDSELKNINLSKQELQNILALMAARSSHIIIQPFLDFLNEGKNKLQFSSFEEVFSKGIKAEILNKTFKLGSSEFVIGKPHVSEGAMSKLYFSVNNILIAVFEMGQHICPLLVESIKSLAQQKEVYILSGDQKSAVEDIAAKFSIPLSNALHSQTPESKLSFIEKLSHSKKIMMVGDGVNDLLALKKSNVSVSILNHSKNKISQSDIILGQETLKLLPSLFKAAKKVKTVVYANLLWAFIFNLLGILLVAKGIVGPISSALLMPLSSLVVVLFSVKQRYI